MVKIWPWGVTKLVLNDPHYFVVCKTVVLDVDDDINELTDVVSYLKRVVGAL